LLLGYRQIKTVIEATVLLGVDTVQAIVLASTVGKVMEKELKGYSYEQMLIEPVSHI
jgi:HD-like signal output (HDOD) protein